MPESAEFTPLVSLAAIRQGFRSAISCAVQTLGATAPNPSVGCVLLDKRGEILSLGVHPSAGQPHAEIMALEVARAAGVLDQARVALVTLEPCTHHGRTPPCSEYLRNSPVQEIWIGAADPNPLASGGARFLARNPGGKRVRFLADQPELADLAQDCQALLAPFASRIERKRPWLSVKQALDAWGNMVPPPGQKTFTSEASLELAHRLRRATDAVVTGVGTVLADWPLFTIRRVADHALRAPRLLLVCDRHNRLPAEWCRQRRQDGFKLLTCSDLYEMPALLAEHGVNWALIEAGPTLLTAVKEADLWDDWLTICKGAEEDRVFLKSRAESPLRLLRENACSLAS